MTIIIHGTIQKEQKSMRGDFLLFLLRYESVGINVASELRMVLSQSGVRLRSSSSPH